jgi:hypothetical protein
VKPRSRVAVGLAALVLLGVTVLAVVGRLRAGGELGVLLADTGLSRRQPDLAEEARREPDPVRARLLVARALVAEAVDQSSFNTLPPREAAEEAARVGERLRIAEDIAASSLAARPAQWQPCMLLGAARYLGWSRSGDTRLMKDRAAWEKPLEEAVRRAPQEEEPLQLLALTRLELWPTFDETQRLQAREVLERAFKSDASYRKLVGTWLAVARNRNEAWSLIPTRSSAWHSVADSLAVSRDWDGFIAARGRESEAVAQETEAALVEGKARLAGGDRPGARGALLRAMAGAPLDRVGARLIGEAMALLPAGGSGGGAWGVFAPWVRFATEHMVRGQRGLPPDAVARMLAAAGVLAPPEHALLFLAASDLGQAETLERRAEDANREEWAPYFLAKTWMLAERRDLLGAREALGKVHRDWAGRLATVRARVEVARRIGDSTGLAAALQQLQARTGNSWPATEWQWHRGVATLELQAATAADGLLVAIDEAPPSGAVVALALDDEPAELFVARHSAAVLVAGPLAEGFHVLTLSQVAGGRALPGQVSLNLAGR